MVEEIPVAHTVRGAELCGTGGDETLLLQHVHVLFHGVLAVDADSRADGAVAGIALVGPAVLQVEEVGVDRQFSRAEMQGEDLIGQHEIMRAASGLVPGVDGHRSTSFGSGIDNLLPCMILLCNKEMYKKTDRTAWGLHKFEAPRSSVIR